MPSVVKLFILIFGLGVVLQHTPFVVIGAPPSERTILRQTAEFDVTEETSVAFTVGRRSREVTAGISSILINAFAAST